MPHASIVSSQIGPLLRFGNENSTLVREGRVSTSSPLANTGMMHGSPLSDDSSQHSDSGVLHEDTVSNGAVNHSRPKPLNNALYSQCVLTMCTLANDPSPRIASLGRRVLSIIGIEQVVTKPVKPSSSSIKPTDGTAASQPPSFAGLARSSSWFDMNGGMFIIFGCALLPLQCNFQKLCHQCFDYFECSLFLLCCCSLSTELSAWCLYRNFVSIFFYVRSFAFNFPNSSSQPSQTKLLDGHAKSLLVRVPASANEFS